MVRFRKHLAVVALVCLFVTVYRQKPYMCEYDMKCQPHCPHNCRCMGRPKMSLHSLYWITNNHERTIMVFWAPHILEKDCRVYVRYIFLIDLVLFLESKKLSYNLQQNSVLSTFAWSLCRNACLCTPLRPGV